MTTWISGVSPSLKARIAGAVYLISGQAFSFSEFSVRGKLVVDGDASATAGNGAKVFRPGETLSWDEEKHSNPIVLGAGFKWRPDDAVEFTRSIERFHANKLAQLKKSHPD